MFLSKTLISLITVTGVVLCQTPLPIPILGPIEAVIDWPTNHCNCSQAFNNSPGCTDANDPDVADTPPRAYVDTNGATHFWATDAESRASIAAPSSSGALIKNCTVSVPSAFNCDVTQFNFQTWLHSPYLFDDGLTAIAFVHMEYHGWSCANVSKCTNSNGGDCALEAIQQFESIDGGWSWQPSGGLPAPANLVAVSPYTYEYSRDVFNHSEIGFGDPGTIVRGRGADSDNYYVLISASNPAIGTMGYFGLQIRGQCLLRTATPRDHTSWRAWDGTDFTVRFANPYIEPITNISAHICSPVKTTMIIVSVSWSTYFNEWVASGFGSFKYPNGTVIPCCGAWLYQTSNDLFTWGQPQLVRPNKQEGLFPDWEYDGAFLDPSASERGFRNWHDEIGSNFYLYFWAAQPQVDPRARSVFRQSVTLP
jgi:hypothetical protein